MTVQSESKLETDPTSPQPPKAASPLNYAPANSIPLGVQIEVIICLVLFGVLSAAGAGATLVLVGWAILKLTHNELHEFVAIFCLIPFSVVFTLLCGATLKSEARRVRIAHLTQKNSAQIHSTIQSPVAVSTYPAHKATPGNTRPVLPLHPPSPPTAAV